jgi:excisionase family DNA binding protein
MEPLLKIPEAAALLKISAYTLRTYCRRGLIAHHKIGGAIRISAADLESFVSRGRVPIRPERQPEAERPKRKAKSAFDAEMHRLLFSKKLPPLPATGGDS